MTLLSLAACSTPSPGVADLDAAIGPGSTAAVDALAVAVGLYPIVLAHG